MADVHAIPLTQQFVQLCKAAQVNRNSQTFKNLQANILHDFEVNHELHAYYNEMKVLDMQRNHLVSLAGIKVNEANQEWFKGAIENSKKTAKGAACQDLWVGSIEHCGELDLPSIHISHVIRDYKTWQPIGMFVVDCNVDHIEEIMEMEVGLGSTGESYLVGPDHTIRSKLRHDHEATLFQTNVATFGVEDVFDRREANRGAGICKKDVYDNYEGKSVLAHNHYLKDLDLAVLTEVEMGEVRSATLQLLLWIGVVAVGIGVVVVVIALFVAKSITKPIHHITEMAQDIAVGDGDLTKRIDINLPQPCSDIMQCGHPECPAYGKIVECWVEVGSFSDDVHCPKIIEGLFKSCHECKAYKMGSIGELGELSNWFNTFVRRIRGMITKIKDNATGVTTASGQIASASEQLAAGAEEQQSQLSEVATTMEQMSAMILESSKNADETRQNAQTAGQTAGTGRETVTKTVSGFQTVANTVERAAGQIQELSTRSEEIGNVIQVIDEIADQTNLLALNANIEAARAGEAGRGFAVVADEVRKLAERTVSATGEIGKMIESIQGDITAAVESMTEIQTQSNEGLEMVSQSDSSLEEISGSVNSVVSAVEQIASAANEQSSGAEEVSKNIEGVSTVAKQSASSAQELAASAEQLNKEIQSMNELIGQFKVE